MYGLGRVAVGKAGRRETRQDRILNFRPVGAALRNLDRTCQSLRQIGKKLHHFVARFETEFRRELDAVFFSEITAGGDARERIMRFEIFSRCKQAGIGGNQRQTERVGKIDELRFKLLLGRQAVALQLDVQIVREECCELFEQIARFFGRAMLQQFADRPSRATG